ncbi:MAG: D-sedoheptulose 7-phosphate isomerase [Verrucomicrobiota bacterium]
MPSLSEQWNALKVVVEDMERLLPDIEKVTEVFVKQLQEGKKVLSCGNGGSASDAMHIAEELVGRYRGDRKSLPAIALTADGTSITCIANDWSYDEVFSRQIEGLGSEGDLLIAFTTSGNSSNILKAIEQAKAQGMITIALLGKDGGQAKAMADHSIVVPSHDTARIQELHTWILHVFLEAVEAAFLK